jgi:hypothetical protein
LLDSLQPYWRALHASQATLAPSQISSPCLPLYRPLLSAFSTSLPAELWAQILKVSPRLLSLYSPLSWPTLPILNAYTKNFNVPILACSLPQDNAIQ